MTPRIRRRLLWRRYLRLRRTHGLLHDAWRRAGRPAAENGHGGQPARLLRLDGLAIRAFEAWAVAAGRTA